jgi:glycosyltransferase involved in cell wall biosynthesis
LAANSGEIDVRIAAFISHPIQYFTPLWQELAQRPNVSLEVFYFSRQGLDLTRDPGFGISFSWDIDLLAGHDHSFLPRQWPTHDAQDPRPSAINTGIWRALARGWDAVFINGYVHLNNLFILAACRRLGIPVLCFADSTLHADLAKPRVRQLLKQAALTTILSQVSGFLAAGGQTRAYFEHYGAPSDRIFICPYAVDIARFRSTVQEAKVRRRDALRESFGIAAGKRVVMFCGKLIDRKRPLDLLHALRALQRVDTVAVFVGEGPLRERIAREAEGIALTTGFVNQRDIPIALSLADLIVLPSSFEPYGMVVAEAQALGVPALVSDACGCHGPESVVLHGESGFVYPVGDVSALSHQLSTLLSDDALYARFSACALRRAETQSAASAADGLLAAAERGLR